MNILWILGGGLGLLLLAGRKKDTLGPTEVGTLQVRIDGIGPKPTPAMIDTVIKNIGANFNAACPNAPLLGVVLGEAQLRDRPSTPQTPKWAVIYRVQAQFSRDRSEYGPLRQQVLMCLMGFLRNPGYVPKSFGDRVETVYAERG